MFQCLIIEGHGEEQIGKEKSLTERPLDQLTLRELFSNSEKLARELIEHLDKGFVPKVRHLHEMVQGDNPAAAEVLDVTVRNHAATVLAGDDFSQGLCAKMDEYLSAIEHALSRHIDQ
jgi:hypothetical protein